MKKFVYSCITWTVIFALAASVCAAGLTGMSGSANSGGAMMSEQLAPTDDAGTAHDAGITGSENAGNTGNSASGTESTAETGAQSGSDRAVTERSVSPVNETTGSETDNGGVSWFAVILAIVIVAAIFALAVALLPKRRGM